MAARNDIDCSGSRTVDSDNGRTVDNGSDAPDKANVTVSSPPRQVKRRPSHFLALRIDNRRVHHVMKKLQRSVMKKAPELEKAMISPIKLHITLFVFPISSEEELATARAAHVKCQTILDEIFPTSSDIPTVNLNSINSFDGGKVVFLEPEPTETDVLTKLTQMYGRMKEVYEDAGIEVNDSSFIPHATVIKLSQLYRKLKKGDKKPKKIPKPLFEGYSKREFGQQKFTCVDLLAMQGQAEDGFYPSIEKVWFQGGREAQTMIDQERADFESSEDDEEEAAAEGAAEGAGGVPMEGGAGGAEQQRKPSRNRHRFGAKNQVPGRHDGPRSDVVGPVVECYYMSNSST